MDSYGSTRPAEPTTPMQGPVERRRLEVTQPPQAEGGMVDTYRPPARPSTLEREADPMESVAVKLARRRLSPELGRRRL